MSAPASLVTDTEATRADAGVAKRVAYWQIVLAQLRKNRPAMIAWVLVKGLLFVACAAPLLAFSVPLVQFSGSPTFPVVSLLFDRTLFESGVDLFFNYLLLVIPAWIMLPRVVSGYVAMARGKALGVWGTIQLLLTSLVLVVFLPVEVWAAIEGRATLRVVVAIAFVGGALRTTLTVLRGMAIPVPNLRLAVVLFFVVGAALPFAMRRETSLYKIWHGPSAAAEVGSALFPPIPYHPNGVGDPETIDRARKHPDGDNLLGGDLNGRDVLARIFFGTRISVTIGLVAVSIYVLIGMILGSLAGYYGGKVDLLISRFIEVMICFPTLFLLLTIIAVFETRSIFMIMLAIGVVGWPGVARLVRGEFLRQRSLDYVTAALALGLKQRRVIFRHVLPNCLGPVLVSATFGIASAILTESGIAFLGLGDQKSISWGQMLTTGRESQEWHLILVPGFAIFFVVFVFNMLGEGLRDALDPKLRR